MPIQAVCVCVCMWMVKSGADVELVRLFHFMLLKHIIFYIQCFYFFFIISSLFVPLLRISDRFQFGFVSLYTQRNEKKNNFFFYNEI